MEIIVHKGKLRILETINHVFIETREDDIAVEKTE